MSRVVELSESRIRAAGPTDNGKRTTGFPNPLGTKGLPSYFELVLLAGRFSLLLRVLVMCLVFVAVTAIPADATFYPPSIRLALLFDRVQWQSQVETLTPLPRRHIAESWER